MNSKDQPSKRKSSGNNELINKHRELLQKYMVHIDIVSKSHEKAMETIRRCKEEILNIQERIKRTRDKRNKIR